VIVSSPEDFREAARRRLPPFLFDYVDGGAGAEVTLRQNSNDLLGTALRQKVLSGVSSPEPETRLFGITQALPMVLAPVGLTGMYARRGEVQAARAAAGKGIPFCLSTVSVCAIDEVVSGSKSPIWFQLYVIRDRGFMRDLLTKAKLAGCTALVVTVDMPVPGARYRDARSGMSGSHATARRFIQALRRPAWTWDVGIRGRPHTLGNVAPAIGSNSGLKDFMGWLAANFDATVDWRDLESVRELWDGPLIIKGILDVDDAQAAVAVGADGIVVSNHGGRQLDGAPSTTRMLPMIADGVGDRLTVLADSGVRSGTDIFRLMALGAKGVLLGRAWVYALAARGERGVTQLLNLLESELRVAMTLTGCANVSQINRDALVRSIAG
jgi:L-lactate dehydrogenase (cytochrome)